MKKLFFTIAASAICGMSFAQTFSVSDVEVKPGDKAKADLIINIPESYASKYLNGFEFEKLVVDEGITVTDIIPNAEWDPAAQGGITTGDGFFYGGLLSFADDGLLPLGSDFVIASLEIEVDESVTPGQVLTATFPAGTKFTFTPGVYVDAEDYSFNINVVSSYSITLDETSTVAPEPMEGVNVKVLRTITGGNWSTICLPFAITADKMEGAFGAGVEVRDFNNYDYDEETTNIKVQFVTVNQMEANHPYIIKVSSNITEFSVEDVNIDPEEFPTKSFGYWQGSGSRKTWIPIDFNGTYVADFDFYSESVSGAPLFISGNKFYVATEETEHMKAFRGYFDFADIDVGDGSRLVMSFDEMTGIKNVTYQTDGEYYDLKGQRVETPAKGVYIKDGKKVVVK